MSGQKKNEETKPTLALLKADPKTGKPSAADVDAFMTALGFPPDEKDGVAPRS